MRQLDAKKVTDCVARLCIESNRILPPDVEQALRCAQITEPWPAAREILGDLARNLDIARERELPMCQDTGLTTVFLELGQELYITGGSLNEAVQEGVRRGYTEGYLRKSVVRDPLRRENTGDNTPATIYTSIVDGDALRIIVAPKGAGSENMCKLTMLTPAAGESGARSFIVDSVKNAGGNPCPPTIVGVGIGGGFDSVTRLAKEALLRSVNEVHPDPYYAAMEAELLEEINASGIGPQGLGGKTTALRVLIKAAPTHIAMLPVAVCISCHAARHAMEVL